MRLLALRFKTGVAVTSHGDVVYDESMTGEYPFAGVYSTGTVRECPSVSGMAPGSLM